MVSYDAFDAGTAYLTVSSRLSDTFRADVERDLARINTELHVPLVADTVDFAREVETTLTAARGQSIDVALNLDAAAFQARLDQIANSSGFTVDVDLRANFGTFRAELEAISQASREQVTINVDLDTRAAAAELAAFLAAIPRSVTINVDVDTRVAADEIENLMRRLRQRHTIDIDAPTGPLDQTTRSANKASFALKGIGLIKWPAIVAGVTALATAVGGLAGVAGGAAAALGVLAAPAIIGSLGMMDAFTAGNAAAASASDDAKDAADRQAEAIERVGDAQYSVESGIRSVESAERSAAAAQQTLNDAYRAASRELRDMNTQLKDAELSQEGAAIAVARAKENLARVKRDPKASKLDRQEADLQLRTAQSRYSSSKTTTADLRTDTAEANSDGIAGSDTVKNAQQGVKDANQAVIDANRGVAESIKDLAKAQQELAESTESSGSAQDKLAEALAKLSPNARDFYDKVKALGPAWKEMQQVVQDNMFDGLGDAVTDFSDSQLGHLTDGFGRLATSVNTMLKGTLSSLDDMMLRLGGDGTMDKFLGAAESAATGIGPLITGIVEAFVTMGAQMGDTIGPLLTQWGESIAMMGEPLGKLGAVFAEGMTDGDNGIATLVVALADGLIPLVPPVLAFFEKLGDLIRDNLPQISRIGGALVEGFGGALEVIEPMLPPILDAIEWLANAFADNPGTFMAMFAGWNVLANVTAGVGSFMKQWDNIGSLITRVRDFGLAQKIASAATKVWSGAVALFNIVMSANPIVLVGIAIAALVAGLIYAYQNVDWFREAIDKVWDTLVDWAGWLGGFFVDLWNGLYENVIRPVWDAILGAINWAKDGISTAFEAIGQGVDVLKGFFSGLGDGVESIWDGIVNTIAKAVEQIGKLLKKAGDSPFPFPGRDSVGKLGNSLVDWASATKRADGGPIHGPGGPTDDVVPAWLSNGEYVVNAAATSKHRPLIEAINEDRISAFKDGGFVYDPNNPYAAAPQRDYAGPATAPAPSQQKSNSLDAAQNGTASEYVAPAPMSSLEMAQNGSAIEAIPAAPTASDATDWSATDFAVPASPSVAPVTGVGKVALDGNGGSVQGGASITSAIQQSMWDAVRTAFPSAILTSGTRYQDVGSGFDNHMGETAIDLGGPMPDIARWIYGLNPSQTVEELIHAPLDGWENLKKGSPLNYGAATDADHYDHVHWAMAQPVVASEGSAPADVAPGSLADQASATGDLNSSTDAITDMGDLSGSDSSGSGETTWSGLAGGVADAFVSGMLGDALGVFGISDEMPGAVKAGKMLWDLTKDGPYNADGANEADSPAGTGLGVGEDSLLAGDTKPAEVNPFDHVYDPAGGVEQWRGVVDAVLKLGGWSEQFADKTLAQMRIESSGNPRAQNNTDSNAAAGTPSKGLMQTIQGTYDAFKSPNLLDDIWDPANNIFAALNYVETDPKFNGRGVEGVWPTTAGYANGGSVWGAGTSTSDSIPAWLSDREFVMNAKSADANRPLLEAMNQDANFVDKSIIPMFRGMRGGAAASSSNVDNSMVVNLSTPDVDSAFRKAKTLEAQRSLTYIRR